MLLVEAAYQGPVFVCIARYPDRRTYADDFVSIVDKGESQGQFGLRCDEIKAPLPVIGPMAGPFGGEDENHVLFLSHSSDRVLDETMGVGAVDRNASHAPQ